MLIAAVVGFIWGAGILPAQTTPLDQKLEAEIETDITCELTDKPKRSAIPVFNTPEDTEAALGTYHYKLWLPKGYHEDTKKEWPCMFIMSAGGNAKMGKMADYLKTNGYIVVMLVEAENGPWPPIVGNFLAAHDDVVERLRVGDKYATGASGGARGSSVFVQIRPGFTGLILQAAGVAFDDNGAYFTKQINDLPKLRVAMLMGNQDRNKVEVERMENLMDKKKFKVFPFEGGHGFAPGETFAEAMNWIVE
ncbi:MAG: hypothetical protein HC901_01095 [Bdellovibrionaceae bacterium]|nr:hypothetical protein [Pseudobdellovibrionaceae bacterium]